MNQDELRAKFRSLPDLVTPQEGWARYCQSIRGHARNEKADNFIQWSTIQATMFTGNAPYIEGEIEALKNSSTNWKRWDRLIKDPGVGNPTYSDIIPHASGHYIHQCYLLNYLEQTAGIDVADLNVVVEIGAGFGALRNIFAQAGFQGDYFIYDLPEMLLLQEYYFEEVLSSEQLSKTYRSSTPPNSAMHVDLILGLTSISEMPVRTRKRYFDKIFANYYFFTAQSMFYDVQNDKYFLEFAEKNDHLDWDIRKNPNGLPAHDFVVGQPKQAHKQISDEELSDERMSKLDKKAWNE